MSRRVINTVKVLYKDIEFWVIPANYFTIEEKVVMWQYVKAIGDVAFLVDKELYLDSGALFNLTMKYCDEYDFI